MTDSEVDYNPDDLIDQLIPVENNRENSESTYIKKSSKKKKLKKNKLNIKINHDKELENQESNYENNHDISELDNDNIPQDYATIEENFEESDSKSKSNKQKLKKLVKNKTKTKSIVNKKYNMNNYFEDYADDIDESENYSSDGEVDNKELNKIKADLDRRRLENRENIAKKLEDKYVNNVDQDNLSQNYENDLVEEKYADEYHDKQPRMSDPKLWLIKCRLGKEKECVVTILHKYFYNNKSSNMKIFSAFSIDALKGYIYIEAYKEANVREAIAGMSNLRENSIKIVPINEMIQVFNFDKLEKVDIKENQWVRIKSGLYDGDLAQIIGIEDSASKIHVKLIPRIFDSLLTNNNGSKKPNIGEYSKNIKKNLRPKQQFYNPNIYSDETKMHGYLQKVCYYWRNKFFLDGFIVKCLKLKNLIINDVVPTIEELKIFESANLNNSNNNNKLFNSIFNNINNIDVIKKNNYLKGDKVKFVKGNFKNITGTVLSHSNGVVRLIPDVANFKEEIDVPEDQLKKHFLPGDIVTVEKGTTHIGKSGIVAKLEDDTALIFSDVTMTQFKVNVNDLVHSSRATKEKLDNQLFEIEDLVRINGTNEYCFILDIQAHSLKLLDLNAKIKNLSIRDVTKINTKKNQGIDIKKNPLFKGDKIKVVNGYNKGKKGVIKCIFKNYVYLYNQEFFTTNGIYLDKTDNLEIMGSELLEDTTKTKGVKINMRIIPDHLKCLMGKPVRITKGNWKGYIGYLRAADEKKAKVELLSRNKTIQIGVNDVKDLNDDNINVNNFTTNKNNNNLAKTPAYYPQSPGNNILGTSPKWNPSTPGNAWSSNSPYHTMTSSNLWDK